MLSGVYVTGDQSQLASYESWLGQSAGTVAVHSGRASWLDYETSIGYDLKTWAGSGHNLNWTIPMFANGGTLAQAASGAYDSYYVQAAKQLAAGTSGTGPIYIRTGEEFNGTWFPWAANGHQADFISAYQHFVDAFRSVDPRFKFEWNVSVGDTGFDPSTAYPGDKYVDVVGMDFYYDMSWGSDPLVAWNTMVNRKYGLQWVEDFAAAHGKPTAYSEWGVVGNYAGAYIDKAAAWFQSHNVVYENYWNSTSGSKNTMLSNGQYLDNGMAYKEAFAGYVPPNASGDNVYVATSSSQVFPEVASGGYDTVQASVSYRLGDHIEKLVLTGTAAINGTGNTDANLIVGNDANNKLLGLSGADTLMGGGGADTLDGGADKNLLMGGTGDDVYIYNPGDTIVENPGEGNDTVYSAYSITVPANVENVILTGSGRAAVIGSAGNDHIVGNSAANQLQGNAGADTLEGGGGADTLVGGLGADVLTGGAGNDVFQYYKTSESTVAAPDRITDLTVGDKIDLSHIDANTKIAGDQAFKMVAAFDGQAGEAALAYNSATNITTLSLDVNGDKIADSVIQLTGDQRGFTGWIL
jgi:Ca2+-binding RTX toxin-like protein